MAAASPSVQTLKSLYQGMGGEELVIPAALGGLQGEAAAVSAQGRQAPCPHCSVGLERKSILKNTP